MKKNILFLLALLLAGTFSPALVSAQSDPGNESITLSPVNKRFTLDAGTVVNDKLTVINDGGADYDLNVYARPYSVSNESYDPVFDKTADNTDVYQWIQFKQTKYSLKAGQSAEIPFTVTVPATAVPGGHYGVIFAETQPKNAAEGNAVVRKKRVGSIVYATVNGDYTNKGSISDTEMPFWQLQPPLMTTARVTNEGTAVDFVDKATLTVRDVFGRVKFETEKEYAVLPQTTRKVTLSWDDAHWFGLYNVEATHKFLDKTETDKGYVLIMPRYILIVFIVVLLGAAGYGIYRFKKRS